MQLDASSQIATPASTPRDDTRRITKLLDGDEDLTAS